MNDPADLAGRLGGLLTLGFAGAATVERAVEAIAHRVDRDYAIPDAEYLAPATPRKAVHRVAALL